MQERYALGGTRAKSCGAGFQTCQANGAVFSLPR